MSNLDRLRMCIAWLEQHDPQADVLGIYPSGHSSEPSIHYSDVKDLRRLFPGQQATRTYDGSYRAGYEIVSDGIKFTAREWIDTYNGVTQVTL